MNEAGLEQKYIKEAFDTNWVVPLGPNVNGFDSACLTLDVNLINQVQC